jgi:hypothetical protein
MVANVDHTGSFLLGADTDACSQELFHDWQFTANQFALPSSPLKLTTFDFLTKPLRS